MSNRKYAAAVLEGGPASDNDRMKSITDILATRINDIVKDILDGNWVPTGNEDSIFLTYIQRWFEEMSPALAKEYEIQVGTVENVTAPGYRVIVGHRPKPRRDWWNNDDFMSATIGSIDASRITAGTITADRITTGHIHNGYIRANDTQRLDGLRDIQTIRVNERYGMGVINTGGVATVGNIHFHDTVSAVGVSPILFQQNEPFDLTVNGTTYRNVEVTGVVEDA